MATAVKRYTDLVVWQKAMTLVEDIYEVTRNFPKEELYGLTSQLRRSAVSVPSNIAEGHCRMGRREFAHHISIALGSLGELETQVLIAQRFGLRGRKDAGRTVGDRLRNGPPRRRTLALFGETCSRIVN